MYHREFKKITVTSLGYLFLYVYSPVELIKFIVIGILIKMDFCTHRENVKTGSCFTININNGDFLGFENDYLNLSLNKQKNNVVGGNGGDYFRKLNKVMYFL